MATDGPGDQTVVAEVVDPSTAPVTGCDGEHQGQFAGGGGGQESLLECQDQLFREADAAEPAHHDRVAVTNQSDRVRRADKLVLSRERQEIDRIGHGLKVGRRP